jgi:basic membrane protein A
VIFTGDWSHAGQGGRGHQQPGRPGLSTCSRCTSTARRSSSRPPPSAARWSAATTPARPSWRRKAYLTGAEWNWVTAYKQIIDAARSGKPHPNFVRGGLKDGFVKTSPYGPAVSEAARKNADAVKAKMIAGGFDIFAGEMKDNTGKVVIPKGKVSSRPTCWKA